jgi:hypothetical protein
MDRRDFLKLQAFLLSGFSFKDVIGDFSLPNLPLISTNIKSVVVIFLVGGPSQIETFDYKPQLVKPHGKRISGFTAASGQKGGVIMKPSVGFKQYGQSGSWVSNYLPNIGSMADELTFIHSFNTTSKFHAIAQLEFNTVNITPDHPFIGSWTNYAINGKKQDLKTPGIVLMMDPAGLPRVSNRAWHSGPFSEFESKIMFDSVDKFYEEIKKLSYRDKQQQNMFLDLVKKMNGLSEIKTEDNSIFQQRENLLSNLYQMKDELLNCVSPEGITAEDTSLYGLNNPDSLIFGKQLIATRNLLSSGASFVQIYCGTEEDDTGWDHHFKTDLMGKMCSKIDRPLYGFIQDLKKRNLLDSTLVICSGEFGRLPVIDEDEKNSTGRDHNNMAGTLWMAGGKLKKGFHYGETDELSLRTIKNEVTIGDIWATVLNQIGVNHNHFSLQDLKGHHRLTKSHNRILHQIIG